MYSAENCYRDVLLRYKDNNWLQKFLIMFIRLIEDDSQYNRYFHSLKNIKPCPFYEQFYWILIVHLSVTRILLICLE